MKRDERMKAESPRVRRLKLQPEFTSPGKPITNVWDMDSSVSNNEFTHPQGLLNL